MEAKLAISFGERDKGGAGVDSTIGGLGGKVVRPCNWDSHALELCLLDIIEDSLCGFGVIP